MKFNPRLELEDAGERGEPALDLTQGFKQVFLRRPTIPFIVLSGLYLPLGLAVLVVPLFLLAIVGQCSSAGARASRTVVGVSKERAARVTRVGVWGRRELEIGAGEGAPARLSFERTPPHWIVAAGNFAAAYLAFFTLGWGLDMVTAGVWFQGIDALACTAFILAGSALEVSKPRAEVELSQPGGVGDGEGLAVLRWNLPPAAAWELFTAARDALESSVGAAVVVEG
ncbi:MAG: hypothetical protein ACTSU5_00985, partial [Promethearchaeota archaeon]